MIHSSLEFLEKNPLKISLPKSSLIFFLAWGLGLQASDAVDFETQTLTIALTQEPPQLDSTKATDQVSGMLLGHLMQGLVRYDRRGNVIPG